MFLILSMICVLSCFGGVLLAQSLKGMLIFTKGLEKGQRTMFLVGVVAVVLAMLLSVVGWWINCHCPYSH